MEPWLDSLSEDWNSEKQSSSPAGSEISRRFRDSIASTKSQSRIPHVVHNLRKDSSSGFLKPRSSRGIARATNNHALTERSASSLNLPPTTAGSQKRMTVSSLPRRASSAFSESQNSVQHHNVHERPTDTPEWKRRIANGEEVRSDGFDLFSPSKLEGVFRPPPTTETESSLVDGLTKTWKFELPSAPVDNPYQSMRNMRPTELEVLEEEDEDAETHLLSKISSDLARDGSLRGLVRQRVQSLERAHEEANSPSPQPRRSISNSGQVRDPRWRTISGRQEMMDEFISPVTASRENSIREKALRASASINTSADDDQHGEGIVEDNARPSSSSSDRDVSYGDFRSKHPLYDNSAADMTSQSLPEDLSMGTQDFVSQGGFINQKRGGRSNEGSFLKRSLSSSMNHSHIDRSLNHNFHSSPPPFTAARESIDNSRFSMSLPTTPGNDSVIHHQQQDQFLRPTSGSPLKLFGNRDTYTNNKLMRILSQFEEPEKILEQVKASNVQPSAGLRMSQFGQGELDTFNFNKNVDRPDLGIEQPEDSEVRIFSQVKVQQDSFPDFLTTDINPPTVQENVPTTSKLFSSARTPKRRRTLLHDELDLGGKHLEIKVNQVDDEPILAGKKRKDARPGDVGIAADAEILASRTLLQPKPSRRNSSISDQGTVRQKPEEPLQQEDLTEALAAELASFAHEAVELHGDARKASLATKDYMEEANKVMQFIRARGKPKTTLPEIEEPTELSEMNPDSLLDLDVDDDSSKDNFSRPPSREGPSVSSPTRRHAVHDSQTANYLRKYQDEEELELVANTSGLISLHLIDNEEAQEAALIPMPDEFSDEEQESSPPNIRILNHNDAQRKRKFSTSTVDGPSSLNKIQQQNDTSSSRTFPTTSSAASGNRGMITSGTVTIPDQVGTMTFDHERKIWIRKNEKADSPQKEPERTEMDEDPFMNIPDLSIDEKEEIDSKTQRGPSQTNRVQPQDVSEQSEPVEVRPQQSPKQAASIQSSIRSEVSQHELRLHDGLPSRPPPQNGVEKKQARVVTIAFSSPLASIIKYHNEPSISEIDLDEEVDLPLDDSEDSMISHKPSPAKQTQPLKGVLTKSRDYYQRGSVIRRPVSTIDEYEEDQNVAEMSLVHVKDVEMSTPAPRHLVKAQNRNNQSSLLCLTPLSDFTLHQADSARHQDESYVEERPNPKALRTAHGSLALAVDTLVKAITDAEPTEIYWDHVRTLHLESKNLSTLHGLVDYCSTLEHLFAAGNKITQLGGLPATLRGLHIQQNSLTSLTSWGQLHNLQYVDVSGNQLERLEGFSSLVHLRRLIANDNQIRNIDGVFDLDGLIELSVRNNHLQEIDFEGTEIVNLKYLDLSKNNLQTLKNVQFLTSLEELDVSHNNLDTIASRESLPYLQKLNICNNVFEAFDLAWVPDLRQFYADNNRFQSISSLPNAYHLKTLSLRNQDGGFGLINSILTTPNECQRICLSSNFVKQGTFELPSLPHYNLRELEIAACGISELPSEFGDFFPNCRKLNLNFNAIGNVEALLGMTKLQELQVARNRIKRLRRTCLVLSRMRNLKKVDIRDNPLTVGFYAPSQAREESLDLQYLLPKGSCGRDVQWINLLDETTKLKRRMMELMLAEGCLQLDELDGMEFGKKDGQSSDQTWDSLTSRGVLVKPTMDDSGFDEHQLPIDEGVHLEDCERSLMSE